MRANDTLSLWERAPPVVRAHSLLLITLALTTLAACKGDKATEKPDATTESSAAEATTTASEATPESEQPQPETHAGTHSPSAIATTETPGQPDLHPTGKPVTVTAPTTTARFLLPPKKQGEAVAQLQGCLAVATPSEADAKAHPAPIATRGPKPADLVVAATGGGIVVEHKLTHACCLKGAVSTSVEGQLVTITETLEGTPCRCMCGSTVRTAVGLAPGDYTVKIRVAEPGGEARAAGEKPITVK